MKKPKTQTITDPILIEAMINHLQGQVLQKIEGIVTMKKSIVSTQNLIRKIKREGKHVQIIESNIK